jgi:hypothetical protein
MQSGSAQCQRITLLAQHGDDFGEDAALALRLYRLIDPRVDAFVIC